MTTGSSQVVLADVDSGIADAHPDLAAQLAPGYNVLDGSTNTNDTYGHGTWVAGVMAASSNNGAGIAGYCWTCRLMPVKVYSSSSGAYDSDVATGSPGPWITARAS
jgi:thermitase